MVNVRHSSRDCMRGAEWEGGRWGNDRCAEPSGTRAWGWHVAWKPWSATGDWGAGSGREGLLEIHAGRLGAGPSCSPGEARSFSTTSTEVCRLYWSPAAPGDHRMSALTERKVGLLLSQVWGRRGRLPPFLPVGTLVLNPVGVPNTCWNKGRQCGWRTQWPETKWSFPILISLVEARAAEHEHWHHLGALLKGQGRAPAKRFKSGREQSDWGRQDGQDGCGESRTCVSTPAVASNMERLPC